MQHSGYKRAGYPVDTLMRVLHAEGRWTSPFLAETRPEEELYDLRSDPGELRNLAEDPASEPTLVALRAQLDKWIQESGDRGAVDEGLTVDLEVVRAEKWETYGKRMKSRGLSGETPDSRYLEWWREELGAD